MPFKDDFTAPAAPVAPAAPPQGGATPAFKDDFAPKTPAAIVSPVVSQSPQQAPQPQGQGFKDDFAAPAAPTQNVRLPSGLRPDVASAVDREAHAQGIPVWALRAIARTESGGEPDPVHSTSPTGAQGVMQIEPSTWKGEGYKGNPFNLNDNVKAGAAYYKTLLTKYGDPVKAAGAYNAGPGAFDAYLAGKGTLTKETINYMAGVAAMHVPIDETPLPPHVVDDFAQGTKLNLNPGVSATYETIGKRLPGQQGSNMNPKAAKYQWYDQLFGHQDLPFIMDNVHTLDQISPGKDHVKKALLLYAKNPAAAADAYGDNAKSVLEELAEMPTQKDPILEARRQNARAMLAHPMLALGETFLEEFFNPMSAAEGAITGKIMGLGGVVLRATRAGREASAMASPYRNIVGAHGTKARNDINAMGAVMAHAEQPAHETVDAVMGNLTHAEQWEVLRRSVKGAVPNAAHDSKSAIINPAAALVRKHIKDWTAAKVKAGLLIPDKMVNGVKVAGQVKDVETYLPLRGLFKHPVYNEETIASMKRMGGGGPGSATKGESLHESVYATLDDAVASGKLDMTKHSAATVLYNFLKSSGENVAYENGLKRLAAEHPDMIRPGSMQGNHMTHAVAPLMKDGRQMWAATDKISNIKSPFLQKSWVSPEFADLVNKRAAAHEGPKWAANVHVQNVMQMVTKLNGAQRNMITTNPGYHPFWNIASNASSADRLGVIGTMKNYVQAIVGTAFTVADFARAIPGGAGVAAGRGLDAMSARFWEGSHHYAADVAAAIEAGALQHMAPSTSALGGDLSRIRTMANSELHPLEKVDKILTSIEAWNAKGAFGKFGEERFVVDMYKRRIARGLEPSDAAWEVREALGNIQDVGKNPVSAMIMFYPWLAKNVMHWMLQFMTNPKLARAQIESFHRHNELAGDPNALNAQYRKNPSQLYLGKDEQGQDKNYTAPVPWKDAERVGEALLPGPDDLGERSKVLLSMVTGRAKVVPQDMVNLAMTAYLDPAQREVYNGFTVMYDRNQPLAEELRQGALSVAENSGIYPAPFMVHDIMAHGFDSSHMIDYVTSAVGAGTITRTQSHGMKRPITRADYVYKSQMAKLTKRMQGANPLEPEEFAARRKSINDRHDGVLQRIKDALTKKASPAPAAKPAFVDDFTR